MQLSSTSFADGKPIPGQCAFAVPNTDEHMQLSDNRNPQLSWTDVPTDAKSLVLICTDVDVPSSLDDFNKEGRTVAHDLPRVEFIHWVRVDIPATDGGFAEGECADGIAAGGKDNPPGPPGSRQGINDYTGFMAGDPEMRGDYFGYDGPCPPWNDERVHRYEFALYATDLERCPVEGAFGAADVLSALDGRILAEAKLVGTYSLNPNLD